MRLINLPRRCGKTTRLVKKYILDNPNGGIIVADRLRKIYIIKEFGLNRRQSHRIFIPREVRQCSPGMGITAMAIDELGDVLSHMFGYYINESTISGAAYYCKVGDKEVSLTGVENDEL